MLCQIKGQDIEARWDDAWPAIEGALPPGEAKIPGLKATVLESIKQDNMQLWLLYDKEQKIKAVISTYLSVNNALGVRELFIYSMFTFETLTPDEWKQGLLVLFEYASLCGCFSVGAYSDVPDIHEFVKQAGGYVTNKITIPVDRRV